ncbi:hypothetical protein [Sphingomonas bacterium]|uniref:hypothetical protein n=1 Tax=Sphingomonas bacterium TaxID=1895847 RepID=UPI002617C06E|nr:hypothetical protein [Sphingomonas bacterium]MDB5679681.1 hypothetical protein [Sphingomonas bacterium]
MDLTLAAELDEVNTNFAAAIKGLEAALRKDAPDLPDLGKRRSQLARLAGQRLRFLTGRLVPVLDAGPTAAHVAAARALEERLRALFGESTRHIGDWSSARISSDWPGYVAATRGMIARVEAFLAAERREVYPLLGTVRRAA